MQSVGMGMRGRPPACSSDLSRSHLTLYTKANGEIFIQVAAMVAGPMTMTEATMEVRHSSNLDWIG